MMRNWPEVTHNDLKTQKVTGLEKPREKVR